ncbi:TonB-dependent receptor [Flavobacteriaceae bacterium F08102]|nr:TonB-dependent receptor [Flavobacteriaceae bacterium F08102]
MSLKAQDIQQKESLITIIEKLQSTFDCNFSYIDKDIKKVFLIPPKKDLTLTETVAYLQKATDLSFTMLGNKFITITRFAKPSYSICGYLLDASTNEVISGAVIQTKNSSIISDEKGYFKLENVHDHDLVSFRHISYNIYTDEAQNYNHKDCDVIYLDSKTENLAEVVLTNYLTNGINKIIDGSIHINYRNFGQVPGLIETDVLQTIQALSGFQSIDETVSNINVRGGTHDQNLIMWDGIKMYQSGHFFGLISALNPRITKRVTLIKNGTTAKYTDGVSGTIDMQTDKKVNKDFKAEAGVNFINADVFLDLPVNDKSSVQLAARKSINRWINTPTYAQYFDRAFQNTDVVNSTSSTNSSEENFDFYDVSMRWIYAFSERDKIGLNALYLNNSLSISENAFGGGLSASRKSTLNQQNAAAGINYNHKWSKHFSSEALLSGTKYDVDAVNFDIINEQILTQKNNIEEVGFELNNSLMYNDLLVFKAGYHFKHTSAVNVDKINYPVVDNYDKNEVQSHSISSEINFTSEDFNTHVNLGGRLNYLSTFNKFLIEPRLSINQKINDKITVEILGEFKHQSTTLRSSNENFLGIDSRRWFVSNNQNIPIIQSKQISTGINYKYRNLLIDTEVYYKTVNGITSESQVFRNQYENQLTSGSYDVKGFDFLINNTFGKVNAWIAYSLAKNQYKFNSLNPHRFPSNYDIRHTLSMAGSVNVNSFKFSSGLNWRSGKPTTPILENAPLNTLTYGDPNSENLHDYLRLDASMIYHFNISKKVRAEVGLAVLNLMNKKNVIDQYYVLNEKGEPNKIQQYSLGITPNFSLRFYF